MEGYLQMEMWWLREEWAIGVGRGRVGYERECLYPFSHFISITLDGLRLLPSEVNTCQLSTETHTITLSHFFFCSQSSTWREDDWSLERDGYCTCSKNRFQKEFLGELERWRYQKRCTVHVPLSTPERDTVEERRERMEIPEDWRKWWEEKETEQCSEEFPSTEHRLPAENRKFRKCSNEAALLLINPHLSQTLLHSSLSFFHAYATPETV